MYQNIKKGFTLVELIVVMTILAIMALIILPSVSLYRDKAEISQAQVNLRNVYTAGTVVVSTADNETKEDYNKLMKAVADYANIPKEKIGQYTVVFTDATLTNIKVYSYLTRQNKFINYDGNNFGDTNVEQDGFGV